MRQTERGGERERDIYIYRDREREGEISSTRKPVQSPRGEVEGSWKLLPSALQGALQGISLRTHTHTHTQQKKLNL